MRKRVFVAGGDTSLFMGPGRPEFRPDQEMPSFLTYLEESTNGTLSQLSSPDFDEGVIGSFMAGKFLNQGNLPGFLPHLVPSLEGKCCIGVEGACGTGGRAIGVAVRSILADRADAVFVIGFEMQNRVKPLYGADVLAGAAYYERMRKGGHAHFFPGLFSDRAGAYFKKYGENRGREAMAAWYAQMIENSKNYPKGQEYHNKSKDPFSLGMTPPDPEKFLPYLNTYDCSKITDGAASVALFSEEGLKKFLIRRSECIEIIALGEAEGDITKEPSDLTELSTTRVATQKALKEANMSIDQITHFEIHDCFTISALLAFEALGLAKPGGAPEFILGGNTRKDGKCPTNISGGLIGFGHPTGASGVRQMVDLFQTLKGKDRYGMMVSMGGNDKTVSSIVVKG